MTLNAPKVRKMEDQSKTRKMHGERVSANIVPASTPPEMKATDRLRSDAGNQLEANRCRLGIYIVAF